LHTAALTEQIYRAFTILRTTPTSVENTPPIDIAKMQ